MSLSQASETVIADLVLLILLGYRYSVEGASLGIATAGGKFGVDLIFTTTRNYMQL